MNSGSGRHNLAFWLQLAGVWGANGAPLDQESPGSSPVGATEMARPTPTGRSGSLLPAARSAGLFHRRAVPWCPIRTADAVLAAAMVLLIPLDARFASMATRPQPRHATAPDTLRQPPTLRNRSTVPGLVDVDLTAAPAHLQLMPGGPLVDVYAYNGMV